MTGWELTALLVALALAVLVGTWLVGTANRLDRLHVRTDSAWAALDAALARRAVVARAVSGTLDPDPGDILRAVAERAENAPRRDRESAENELTRALAPVDRQALPLALAAELVDAEHRVVIARRVHGDAVRDTLTQRRRRAVRWFTLAGTAPSPEFFEIVEPTLAEGMPRPRPSARVVLLDAGGRVLLFHGHDPGRAEDTFWFTAGGGVEPGEELRVAAVRELREETGVDLAPAVLVGPVWRRRVVFSFEGRTYDGEEWFFVTSLPEGARVDTTGFTDLEARTIVEHRWWSAEELQTTTDTIYPVQLGELLPQVVDGSWDGTPRAVR
ncbi:MAG: NUDIX domain-containing protein [Actinomycetota bacterium]|nr:NUDIX domain-containing protein [Actinomycetota bacterium]